MLTSTHIVKLSKHRIDGLIPLREGTLTLISCECVIVCFHDVSVCWLSRESCFYLKLVGGHVLCKGGKRFWWGSFVIPLLGNGYNLVFHFPFLSLPPTHIYSVHRQSSGAQASLWNVYFDLHVCFMSVENVFCLASFPPSNRKSD